MAKHPEIAVDDEEIAALLEELEAEQQKMTAAAPTPVPAPEPAPEPAPVPPPVAEKEPEPEPQPESEPVPVKEPEPEPTVATEAPTLSATLPLEGVAESAIDATPPAPKLSFYVDVNQFNRDTKLTEATLDAAMMEQAGLRAYYGSQAAQAEAQHSRLKVRFDVLEAKLYDEHRKALATGGEKVTEKMVENAVKLDPRWAKAKNAVIEAETIASINKSLVISLADRRDMMIQLGADRREEFKGGVRIMAEQNERDSLAARARDAFKNGRGVQ